MCCQGWRVWLLPRDRVLPQAVRRKRSGPKLTVLVSCWRCTSFRERHSLGSSAEGRAAASALLVCGAEWRLRFCCPSPPARVRRGAEICPTHDIIAIPAYQHDRCPGSSGGRGHQWQPSAELSQQKHFHVPALPVPVEIFQNVDLGRRCTCACCTSSSGSTQVLCRPSAHLLASSRHSQSSSYL